MFVEHPGIAEAENEEAALKEMLNEEGFDDYKEALVALNKIQHDDELLAAIRLDYSKLVRDMDPTVPMYRRFENIRRIGIKINDNGGIGWMHYWLTQFKNYVNLMNDVDAYALDCVVHTVNHTWDGIGQWQA